MPTPSPRRFVLTTVGISVLLNVLGVNEEALKKDILRASNDTDLSSDLAGKVDELSREALFILEKGNVFANRRLSAELNGLYGLYEDQLANGHNDIQFLIATDTALGKKAAEVIRIFLKDQGLAVDIFVPRHLSTATPQDFSTGIKELIEWCENTVPGYRDAGYQIIFNLTGAFKSLQGYLNIVGMFYADEITYIFESAGHLLSIPRLPISIDINVLKSHQVKLALMAAGHIYTIGQAADIPAGLLDIDGQDVSLSNWGLLIWNRVARDLLGEALLEFPRLQYTQHFRADFKAASSDDRVDLQKTLARVSSLLENSKGDTTILRQDGGIQYSALTGKKAENGRPVDHFRLTQNRRISCTSENSFLHLRRFGQHDNVNNNP